MGKSILAFDLPEDEWRQLEQQNRRDRHLQMPCCSAQVILRRSRRGTRHFAHKSVGHCTTASETETHLRLKMMAVEVARTHGWHAETEVSDDDAGWRADVLARKGSARVAIEIQWSPQTEEETWRRQERYKQAGVRCLWLFRAANFPVSEDLPAARIGGNAEDGFVAELPTGYEGQSLPMRDLLDAAFDRRLKYGLPLGVAAEVWVKAGGIWCWKCGAATTIITFIEVRLGPYTFELRVTDFTDYPQAFRTVEQAFPSGLQVGVIKKRFSRTQERSYLSNGCFHCGALIGEFFEHDAWAEQDDVCSLQFRIDDAWREVLVAHGSYDEGWGVYGRGPAALPARADDPISRGT